MAPSPRSFVSPSEVDGDAEGDLARPSRAWEQPRSSDAAFLSVPSHDAISMVGAPVEIGEIVAETYRIEGMLGEGAMGIVAVARHTTLGHRVAIKFLHPHIARQATAAERFRREARTAAAIRGAHTCRVLDVGTHAGWLPYLVMEHLEGQTLAHELQQRGALPYQEAVGYVLEACEVLVEAHGRGIVHRDIKPANLFLALGFDGARSIKVLDFGVSKSLVSGSFGTLTSSMSLLGSPLYCSPEHLRSAKDLDARADIWSLGVVLYELLTGQMPFVADSLPQLVHAVLSDPFPAPQALGIDLPDELAAVIERALAKDRDQRFASVAELAGALVPFAPRTLDLAAPRTTRMLGSSQPWEALPAESGPPPHGRGTTSPSEAPLPSPVPQRAHASRPALIAAALSLALGVVGGWAVLGSLASAPPSPDRAPQQERDPAALRATPSLPVAPPLADEPGATDVLGSAERDAKQTARSASTEPPPAAGSPVPPASPAAAPNVTRHDGLPATRKEADTQPAPRPAAPFPPPLSPKSASSSSVSLPITDFGGRH